MRRPTRKTLAVAAAAVLVVGGGGAAIAASKGTSPTPSSFFDALARHLGITTTKLQDAVKAAALDQVDAALKAGTITQAQADALKARINSGDLPFFGLGGRLGLPGLGPRPFFVPGPGFGFFFGPGFGFRHELGRPDPILSASAAYLGLTLAQLRTELSNGKTLADVAKAHGKTVDGLEQAIVAAATKQLDQAVTAGRLTKDREQTILDRFKARLDDLVNRLTFRWRPFARQSSRSSGLVPPAVRLWGGPI